MLKCLVVIPDLCTGCQRCELVCSLVHFKTQNPSRARIHVIHKRAGSDIVAVCNQCGLCINGCPLDLISKDRTSNIVLIDEEKCVGCGLCLTVCPWGCITLDPVKKVALKCDLCKGDPQCVKHCPENALLYIDVREAVYYKQHMAYSTGRRK